MAYSQRGEEEHILKACSGCGLKRFLDIGAWHATELSNSRALFELGWTGVLVEPSPAPVRGLVKEYGHTEGMVVICAAVTTWELGLVKMQITDDAVSSSDPAAVARWREDGGYFGEMMIPAITIPQILNQFGAFSFVSIDTEQSSVDLLRALLATDMLPQCIVVEHDQRIVEASTVAREKGYQIAYMSEENIVFVKG